MTNSIILIFCLLALAVCTSGNTHQKRHEDKHAQMKDAGKDFDRDILFGDGDDDDDDDDGMDDWHPDQLDEQERKNRFTHLAKKMDENTDGFVSRAELVHWTLHALQRMDERELDEDWSLADGNEDGFVDWGEYIENIYGVEPSKQDAFTEADIEELPEIADYNRNYHREFAKFMAADANEDGKLTKEEYSTFYNPGKNPEQTEFAVKSAVEFVDKDGNGMISLEEYSNDYKTPELKEANRMDMADETDVFKSLDLNKNDVLDGEELNLWIQADNGEIAVDEADHLIETADTDDDGKLSLAEVMEAMDDFIESDATQYGTMLRHDEL